MSGDGHGWRSGIVRRFAGIGVAGTGRRPGRRPAADGGASSSGASGDQPRGSRAGRSPCSLGLAVCRGLSGFQAAIKAVEGQPGHPPADPRILVALWLFATIEGIGSARAVARLCDEHIAYQWLCGGMNAKTLADFRVGTLLERLLVDSFTALVRAGAWTGSPRTASGCAHRPEPPRSAEARPWRGAGARPSRRCETCAPRSMAIRARSAGGKPVSAPPKSASAGRRWP